MATFEAQVEGLTSLSIDGSSAPTQTELTQFLTDGTAEVINAMPRKLKFFCATEDTFTSAAVGSEAETLVSGEVLAVTRSDGTIEQPCREIPAKLRGRASDSADMNAATATDPVYYIYNGKINAIPTSGSCKYLEVNNPAVAYGDSNVSNFPNEYEYLIPLYASVKSLQNALGAKAGNSDITTALTAINTEIDETLSIADSAATEIGLANAEVDKATAEVTLANVEVDLMNAEVDLANAEVDLANTEVDKMAAEVALANAELDEALVLVDSGIDTATAAIATAAGRVNTAVALANVQFDSAVTANTAEDVELASSHVNAGNGYLSEAQGSLGEAQGYVNEVSARVNQVQAQVSVAQGFLGTATGYGNTAQGFGSTAQGYIATANGYGNTAQGYLGTASGYNNTAQGYLATANAYLSQIQSKLNIAQAYGNEAQARLNVISTEYNWMEKQQAKLQADYDKGIQIMRGG